MPTDSQRALHDSIIHCIGRWRRVLGIGRNQPPNKKAKKVREMWLALMSLHAAWCDYSHCSPAEFGVPQDGYGHWLPPGVRTSHQAVGEAVGLMLNSLEPKIRPVQWGYSGQLCRDARPVGWADGECAESAGWWPFFNPLDSESLTLDSVWREVRSEENAKIGSDRVEFGSVWDDCPAATMLDNLAAHVHFEWSQALDEPSHADTPRPAIRWKRNLSRPVGRVGRSRSPVAIADEEVQSSLRLVEDVVESLRVLQRELAVHLETIPNGWQLLLPSNMEAVGISAPYLVNRVAELQLTWAGYDLQLRERTWPLLADFAACRATPLQVGGGLFSSAGEALNTLVFEIVWAICATGGWSIPRLMDQVAPNRPLKEDKYAWPMRFLANYYYEDDLHHEWKGEEAGQESLDQYVRENAGEVICSLEELWARLANCPRSILYLGSGQVGMRYAQLLEIGKIRYGELDLDVLEVELKIEHAKVAIARGPNCPRSDPDEPELTVAVADNRNARHSPDYHCVNWYGTEYFFGNNEAACVKVLWECWENGTPEVSGEYLLTEAADCNAARLDLVFRGNQAWGTMIIAGKRKGNYRLNPPSDVKQ